MDITQLAEISLEGSASILLIVIQSRFYAPSSISNRRAWGTRYSSRATTPATARNHPLKYLPPRPRSDPNSAII